MANSDPQKAMGYLQRDLAAVIDHNDTNETQEVSHSGLQPILHVQIMFYAFFFLLSIIYMAFKCF